MDERRTASNLSSTLRALRAWLHGSEEGRTLFGELAAGLLEKQCRACQQLRPYPKVLVVLRRLGHCPGAEVYSERGVRLRFLELPDIPDDGDFVAWTERLMELELPRSWRHMVSLPRRQVSSETFRGVTVESALRYDYDLTVIRGIETARKELLKCL